MLLQGFLIYCGKLFILDIIISEATGNLLPRTAQKFAIGCSHLCVHASKFRKIGLLFMLFAHT